VGVKKSKALPRQGFASSGGWRPIASPSQEEQTDAFGKSAAATVIVALTKHSRCQRGVVDREDLRSVQIKSVFAGKQFDFSKFRRLAEAGEGSRLRVERRADPSNKVLLKERGDLFKQVGLPEVADLDYAAAKTKG